MAWPAPIWRTARPGEASPTAGECGSGPAPGRLLERWARGGDADDEAAGDSDDDPERGACRAVVPEPDVTGWFLAVSGCSSPWREITWPACELDIYRIYIRYCAHGGGGRSGHAARAARAAVSATGRGGRAGRRGCAARRARAGRRGCAGRAARAGRRGC